MAAAGFWADFGIAAAAFVATNIDNTVVTMTMIAGAPLERARRIAAGQILGFVVVVVVAAAAAALLFEISTAVVGLLGLVPLSIGVRGLVGLQRSAGRGPASEGSDASLEAAPGRLGRRRRSPAADRAVGRSFTAAALVTIGAGGDNLAAYIPLFRVGGAAGISAMVLAFALGEVLVTTVVLIGGRHSRVRGAVTRLGAVAVPLLLCGIGVLVMVQAGTFALL